MDTTKLHYVICYKKRLYEISVFLKLQSQKLERNLQIYQCRNEGKENILLNEIHLTQIRRYGLKYPFAHLLISTVLL